ncbi:hypothetical protein HJC23_004376 [Cyclotella cryptica]|uniref:VPS37 C-terminal domain-containing protein n=1 Tax=Cyclotella cryptica TaxID=29204 RepID=A0ABD3PJ52_9STRA|eukprot:CCRYP_014583-RA/>CCRYP_014583-RA protein AED:0.01 eAED:0.01 QI:188/1/1/1/1/1/2/2464/380
MFSWSRPSPPLPSVVATTPGRPRPTPGISRDVHLASYLNHTVLRPSTRRVSVDDTIYDTVFQTTSGFALIIRVYLPLNGSTAPSFTLHGVRASHDWLDIRMRVIGYPPILSDQSWRSSNLRLGDAVYAVIHHFQLNPPTISEITDANLRRLQESLTGQFNARRAHSNSAPPASQRPNGESLTVPHARDNDRLTQSVEPNNLRPTPSEADEEEVNALIPSVPDSFDNIDTMAMSELKQLFDDEAAFENFVQQTSEVSTVKELKQSIEQSNVRAAESNLIHRERMEIIHAELESLQQELQDKLQRYKQLEESTRGMTRPPSLRETINDLNHAKRDALRYSEELAEDWVESGRDVGDFVERFIETRILYHTRAAKAERLSMSM